MLIDSLMTLAAGNWFDILTAAGVPSQYLTGNHGPCPFCGGRDRFRFTNHSSRGGYICNQCAPKGGDGLAFVMAWRGIGFKDAMAWVQDYLRLPDSVSASNRNPVARFSPAGHTDEISESEREQRRHSLRKVWGNSWAINGECLGSIYLRARGVWQVPVPRNLHTIARLGYYTTGRKKQSDYPALLAAVTGADGRNVAIHRTYLNHDGLSKAPVPDAKKMMRPCGPIAGAAVRLSPVTGNTLGVAEGIETALAASMLHDGLPVWSCLTAYGLQSFVVPDGVTELVIFADHDTAGIKAAKALQARYSDTLSVKILAPKEVGSDWADVVAKGGAL